MYFWKCWYSTRWVVAVYLLPIVLMLLVVLRHAPLHVGDALTTHGIWRISSVFLPLTAIAAWILGSIGLGRDIAEGSGAYLLSQPRSIRFFIWSDFAVAMTELVILITLPIGLLVALVQTHIIVFNHGMSFPGPQSEQLSASSIALILIAAILFGGIIYSISYLFMAVLRKTGISIFLSAAFYLTYKACASFAPGWSAPYRFLFPPWWINPYEYPFSVTLNSAMLLAIGARIAAIVLLIFAAQMVAQKVETRA